jgi:hypothetical protein
MRLHPAVAAALVVVGGVLLALPAYEWLRFAVERPSGTEVPSSLLLVSLLSGTLGFVFIVFAVLVSVEPRPGPTGSA